MKRGPTSFFLRPPHCFLMALKMVWSLRWVVSRNACRMREQLCQIDKPDPITRMPSMRSLGFCFATRHRIDALLSISSRPWPMPCASTKPLQSFTSPITRLATMEWRSGGWSDAERLGEVACESEWIRAEICGASMEVTRFDRRVYCWALKLFRSFQDLVGFWRVCSMWVMKTLFLNMEAVIVLWEEQS